MKTADLTGAQLDYWVAEGERLANRIEGGRYGLMIALAFSLGRWWADRPWRTKEGTDA